MDLAWAWEHYRPDHPRPGLVLRPHPRPGSSPVNIDQGGYLIPWLAGNFPRWVPGGFSRCQALAASGTARVVSERHPRLKIVTSAIDEGLNEAAYMMPGIGDFR